MCADRVRHGARRFLATAGRRCAGLLPLLLALIALQAPLPSRAAPDDDDGLPEASAVLDAERAGQVLEDIRRVRAANERARRLKLADCATRFLVNRCVDETERQHRIAADRLRRLERHAQEIIRETRNREDNEARAERERETRERVEAARRREGEEVQRTRLREAERQQRLRDAMERDAGAAENAARHAQRQKAREERAREREEEDRQRAAKALPPAQPSGGAVPAPAGSTKR